MHFWVAPNLPLVAECELIKLVKALIQCRGHYKKSVFLI